MRELPKAEIHVHLEGCLEPETIERLAGEAGERLPRPRDKLMQFADLSDFLRFLDWSCSLVRTADRLTEAAYAFSRRMAVSGAGYADMIVNPTHWTHWHRRVGEMIEALDRGFAAARARRPASRPAVRKPVAHADGRRRDRAGRPVDRQASSPRGRVVNRRQRSDSRPHRAALCRSFSPGRRGGFETHGPRRKISGPEGVRDAIDLLGADRYRSWRVRGRGRRSGRAARGAAHRTGRVPDIEYGARLLRLDGGASASTGCAAPALRSR